MRESKDPEIGIELLEEQDIISRIERLNFNVSLLLGERDENRIHVQRSSKETEWLREIREFCMRAIQNRPNTVLDRTTIGG